MSTRYEVEYYYYQHNSGLADNGNYVKRYQCNTLQGARNVADKIREAIKTMDERGYSLDIEDQLIPYSGYFTKPPVIFELTERKIE